jgi:hypothetical protein
MDGKLHIFIENIWEKEYSFLIGIGAENRKSKAGKGLSWQKRNEF